MGQTFSYSVHEAKHKAKLTSSTDNSTEREAESSPVLADENWHGGIMTTGWKEYEERPFIISASFQGEPQLVKTSEVLDITKSVLSNCKHQNNILEEKKRVKRQNKTLNFWLLSTKSETTTSLLKDSIRWGALMVGSRFPLPKIITKPKMQKVAKTQSPKRFYTPNRFFKPRTI